MSYDLDLQPGYLFVSTTSLRGNYGGVIDGEVSFQCTRGAEEKSVLGVLR
jgi:hypothetical protein